jgi:hypothetical protein
MKDTEFSECALIALLSSVVIQGAFAAESLPWGVERVGGDIVWDKYPGDFIVDSGFPRAKVSGLQF